MLLLINVRLNQWLDIGGRHFGELVAYLITPVWIDLSVGKVGFDVYFDLNLIIKLLINYFIKLTVESYLAEIDMTG